VGTMFDLFSIMSCLTICLDTTTLTRLRIIVPAMLAMTGRVTMLGISRWAEEGGSYRTVQRFFNTAIEWEKVHWCFFRHGFSHIGGVFIIAIDETVITKAGWKTHGLDRFFSSIYGKPVRGLSFYAISLVSTKWRISFPIMIKQVIRSEEELNQKEQNNSKSKEKRGRGRPKGSKNKNKANVELPSYLCFIQSMLKKVQSLIGTTISIKYAVLDGAFGNNNAMQMILQCNMQIISKLKRTSALYFPYTGPYSGRGAKRKYGDKLDYNNIPRKYLKETILKEGIQIEIYQMTMLSKSFARKLNVVIIVKTNLKTGARVHVILFSSDLDLGYDKLIDYYKLRFQIEFNFRDAKQYWGLEDFMNVNEIPVNNAANLAFFMVNVSHALIAGVRRYNPSFSVQDLKAYFRGSRYVRETLKLLPQKPDLILIQEIFYRITKIGSINVG
jgi:putative transposase